MQVPGQKYPQVMHSRLQIRLFPRIIADPGIDFGFLKVPADTCRYLSVVEIRIKTGLILPVICSPLQYLQIKPKNVLIGQELTKI